MARSGARKLGTTSALAVMIALAACWPYGFAGGGLPAHVRTVAVIPFENETAIPDLQRELTDALRRELERRLGLRDASESNANAIVRGTILRYDADVPVGYSADPARATRARRRLQIVLDVEIIDQTTGKTLWQRRGLSAEGEYNENAEVDGRRLAIERIVADVIEGAQSQW